MASAAIPLATSAAADSPSDASVQQVVSSSTPPPDTLSRADMAALQAAAPAEVHPNASTPDGYALLDPGYRRSDYRYDSDTMYEAVYACPGDECTLEASTKSQFRETVVGGSSKRWQLTMTRSTDRNPAGLTWSYSSTYYCGVNISGGSDHTCGNSASASGVSFEANTPTYKDFEHVNNNTVFPMVSASTIFSTGKTATNKFRGWDVLNRASSTKLNTSSGTGD
ncbi:hypothetical protein VSR01_28155 [Actinacidiphila sp. DG2A-62]|uniref:hypothetical protein n=1 Tax=Actinacidiphila sp. DG2A-62 TaxID=3108821 RepID=UPI002DBA8F9E|nr:hypothetical protein [Actinacidiphila sp. DG2A-62]MEC3997165.1 hypothetical protein [Actinacidiphila sp. DG2A-62]